jgi:hypothetical protein
MKKNMIKIMMVVVLALGFINCNIFESDSTSNSALIIESITGRDLEGNTDSPVIFIDVVTNGTVFNDNGTASLTATLINPYNEADTTFYQDIIVDQIDVEYSRSNGQNQEGRDIPFSFSQKVNIKVAINGTVDLPFVIVQHVAKLESPLVDLVNLGEEMMLKLEAKVTFYGHDVGGHRIQPVSGSVSLWCANFGDAE